MEYLGYFWVASFITIVLSTGFLISTLMSGEYKKTSQMIFLGLIIMGLCVMSFIYLFPSESKDWLHTFSDIGQAFGVLNTLFSGFAFVGIYITFKTQREQLEVQKSESAMLMLKESFSELKALGERYESEINDCSVYFNKCKPMDNFTDPVRFFLEKNGISCAEQQSFCTLFRQSLWSISQREQAPSHQLSKADSDLLESLLKKYNSDKHLYISYNLYHTNTLSSLAKTMNGDIGKTVNYRQIRSYLRSIEVVLKSFLDKKASYPELENLFSIWQCSLSDEQLHVIFYFAFYFYPHMGETERRLGELLEKSSLFEYFHERIVNSLLGRMGVEFRPFTAEWFLERNTIPR
ncbi:MAG: hypothetical protein RL368_532 [Pseudomonadota bacterium]|jgi:hypothetical protein